MMHRQESRRSIRLRVTDGLAIISAPGRVPLACAIGDISRSGCLVRLTEGLLHESQIEEWRDYLIPGRRISCELHHPPHLHQLMANAVVCHTGKPADAALDVGLAFVDVTEEFAEKMKAAIPALGGKTYIEPAPSIHAPNSHTSIPATLAPDEHANLSGRPLLEVLVGLGLLTDSAASAAQAQAQFRKMSIHRYLLQNRLATTTSLCKALALSSGLPTTDLDSIEIDNDVTRRFSYLLMMRYEFIPFAESEDTIWIAACAPLSIDGVAELMKTSNKQVLVFLAPANQIRSRLFRLRPRPPYQDRAHVRLRAALPANYELCGEHGVSDDDQHFDGITDNISETGIGIYGPPHPTLPLSDVIEQAPLVRVNLATPRGDVHALCRVRHVEVKEHASIPGLTWQLGTEIVEIDPAEAELLKRVCIELGIDRMRERSKGY